MSEKYLEIAAIFNGCLFVFLFLFWILPTLTIPSLSCGSDSYTKLNKFGLIAAPVLPSPAYFSSETAVTQAEKSSATFFPAPHIPCHCAAEVMAEKTEVIKSPRTH